MNFHGMTDMEIIAATASWEEDATIYHCVCAVCGADFEGVAANAHFCENCEPPPRKYISVERKRAMPYCIEYDPDGDLTGMRLTDDECRYMQKYGSLASGAVIVDERTGEAVEL